MDFGVPIFVFGLNRFSVLLNLLDLGTPLKIRFFWNFGSLLGLFCGVQVLRGIFLRFYYNKVIEFSFFSVKEVIQSEVFMGWVFHKVHRSGSSFFFALLYLHLFRGLYFGGFNQLEIWMRGVSILILRMAIAFFGYVLPWGQMSFWAATVITNLFSAVPYLGVDIVRALWGGYGVAGPTLNRFFSFHFVIPFIMLVLAFLHVFIFLHVKGSSNPLGGALKNYVKIEFFPYFVVKDFLGMAVVFFVFIISFLLFPRLLLDSEGFLEAKTLVTPLHIQPEWYFLPFYAILRSIPRKFGGVLAFLFSIVIFYFFPWMFNRKKFPGASKRKFKFYFWVWAASVAILCFVGASPVEFPWVSVGLVFSFIYFRGVFFCFLCLISLFKILICGVKEKLFIRHIVRCLGIRSFGLLGVYAAMVS